MWTRPSGKTNAFGTPETGIQAQSIRRILGGPIIKDHTFFFRQLRRPAGAPGTTTTFTTISEGPRNGSFGPINPVVVPYL